MAKAILASLDGLSPDIAKEYEKVEQGHPLASKHLGKFALKVDAVDGVAMEDVAGLKTSLSAARTERDEWKGKVLAYGDIMPDQAKQHAEIVKRVGENPDAKVAEQIEGAKRQLTEKYNKDLGDKDRILSERDREVNELLIDNALTQALVTAGCKSVKMMLPIAKSMCRVVRGADGKARVEVIDADGKTARLSQKQGSTSNMEIGELVDTLKTDKEFAAVFPGTGASGTGAGGGKGGSPGRPQNGIGGTRGATGAEGEGGGGGNGSYGESAVDRLKQARREDAAATAAG